METVDGFTDTYESSLVRSTWKQDAQMGFGLKEVVEDDFDYALEGAFDTFAGEESYLSRYYQGQLYSQGLISLSYLNGNESLMESVWDKIKQFLKWAKNKFTGSEDTLSKSVESSIKSATSTTGKELKDGVMETLKSSFELLKNKAKNIREKLEAKNKDLAEKTAGLKEKFPGVYSDVSGIESGDFNRKFDVVEQLFDNILTKLDSVKTPGDLISFLKVEVRSLWKDLIDLYDSRICVKHVAIAASFNEDNYCHYLESKTNSVADEKDKEEVTDNLFKIVQFDVQCRSLTAITDNLASMCAQKEDHFIKAA